MDNLFKFSELSINMLFNQMRFFKFILISLFFLVASIQSSSAQEVDILEFMPAILAAANLNTDNDGDGYSENQGDCNDTDDSIYQGALEICGDGIDQDCFAGDLECAGVVLPPYDNGDFGGYWDMYVPNISSNKLVAILFNKISANTFEVIQWNGVQVGQGTIYGNNILISFTDASYVEIDCASYTGILINMTISGSCNFGILNFEKSKLYFNNFLPGDTLPSTNPTFSWYDYPGADKYFIRLIEDNASGTCGEEGTCYTFWPESDIEGTSVTYTGSPLEAGRYRAKLYALDSSHTGIPEVDYTNFLETFGDITFYVTN